MTDKRKIIDFNQISNKLSPDQGVYELKEYYQTYHRKCWAYKHSLKQLRRWKLFGNSMSIIFAAGGITSSIVMGGASLVSTLTLSLLI